MLLKDCFFKEDSSRIIIKFFHSFFHSNLLIFIPRIYNKSFDHNQSVILLCVPMSAMNTQIDVEVVNGQTVCRCETFFLPGLCRGR